MDFNTKILDIDNFDLSYRKENAVIFILKDIRLSLFLGKFTVLIGRSGCGKTQLAQSIVSLNSQFYKSGSILVNNNNQFENILLYTNEEILQHRKKKVAFIFQDAKQALNPSIKCYDQLVEYIAFVKSYSFQEAKKYAIDLLQKVNLDYNHEVEGKYVHQMSGGQLQRLCIAMAFANDADIIIADEITSALDKDNAAIIYSLIGNHCKKNNKSCLFITHDIEDVQQLADDVHVISNGKIIETGGKELIDHPQEKESQLLIKADYYPKTHSSVKHPILNLHNITIGYRISLWSNKIKTIFSNFNLKINQGEKIGLVGPSGSGKSTLAKAISGIITIQKGKIEWVNNTHRPKCQMIFQNPYSTCNPKMTICEILKEPLEINKISHDEKDIARQLAKVDLPETLLHKYPSELSSGQLQRVCIARALCTKPQLLIMDEAISSLDKLTKVEILHLLDKLIEEESISILFISHDISIANKFCHRIIDLNDK